MTRRTIGLGLIIVAICLTSACAARFSPDRIRGEIERQRGQDPLSVFELNLGRFSTLLLKKALATNDGELPLSGLDQIQLAVFEVPEEDRPAMDVTQIGIRGWEPVIRMHDAERSAMVLVRGSEEAIGDLVVVGAGRSRVVYGRLQGTLSAELPAAVGDALREGGPEEVKRIFLELGDEAG
jgi:hypothetical protein